MSLNHVFSKNELRELSEQEINKIVMEKLRGIICEDNIGSEEFILNRYHMYSEKKLASICEDIYTSNQDIYIEVSELEFKYHCINCNEYNSCSRDFSMSMSCLRDIRNNFEYSGYYPATNELIFIANTLNKYNHFYEITSFEELDFLDETFGLELDALFDVPYQSFKIMETISEDFSISVNNSQKVLMPSLLEDNCYAVNGKVLVIRNDGGENLKYIE